MLTVFKNWKFEKFEQLLSETQFIFHLSQHESNFLLEWAQSKTDK